MARVGPTFGRYLAGRNLSSRDELEDALIQLSVARSLLDALAAHAGTSRDQALAVSFADEIGPEIRHCAHQLGDSKAYDVDAIVAQSASAHPDRSAGTSPSLVQYVQR